MITKEEWKSFRGSHNMPDHIMLSIKNDACRSMTVTWRTDIAVSEGYALVRKKGTDEWSRAEAIFERFDTDMDSSNYFWADMNELEPDTEYEYTVGNDEYRSDVFDFKTSPENLTKFKFLCLSDIQTGDCEPPADYTVLNGFVKNILKKHPDIRFILTAGDNTNCGQTDIQWTGLLDGMKGIIEHYPLMMAMGNHDDMGFSSYFTKKDKYYSEKAEYFSRQFKGSYADNGPKDWKVANYSFDYGNAHFACIGISGPEFVNEWLIEDAKNTDKTWKFGSHHFPICYAGSDLSCDDSYPMMMEGMESYDVMFSGHEHCFSRSFPRRGENLFDKPSQGTVFYNLASGNRNPPGTLAMPKLWNAAWYAHEEYESMYAIAEIDGEKLTLTSYLEDDSEVDVCVIDKKSDTLLPVARAPKFLRTRMMFKGADLGLPIRETPSEKVDGVWLVPAAILFRCIGFDVDLTEGKVHMNAYKHDVTFTEGSDIATVDGKELKMAHEVVRMHRDQLYVPVDGICNAFNMRCNYYDKNNILSFELESQHMPVPFQP